jgi:single-stranded-DNA-specific exonuclease
MRAPAGYGCLDVLSQFDGFVNLGGHDQAAGFTINLQDLDRFKAFLRTAPEAKPAEKEAIPLDPALASVEQIEGLDVLRPFGTGFEEPEFIIEHPQIKAMFDLSQGRHRKFTLDNGLECLRFNQPSKEMSVSVVRIQAFVGTLHVSSYHGKKRPAFHINRIVYI